MLNIFLHLALMYFKHKTNKSVNFVLVSESYRTRFLRSGGGAVIYSHLVLTLLKITVSDLWSTLDSFYIFILSAVILLLLSVIQPVIKPTVPVILLMISVRSGLLITKTNKRLMYQIDYPVTGVK